MLRQKEGDNSLQMMQVGTQSNIEAGQNIQASPKKKKETPNIKVQFGKQIVFTISGANEQNFNRFSWLWRDEWTVKNTQSSENGSTLFMNSPKSNSNYDIDSISSNKASKKTQFYQERKKQSDQHLYTQNEVGLLKKQLEFKYKGLLSKSTDSDSTLGIPVLFRFRCKNYTLNNCQFLHILQYCKEDKGQIYYSHRPFCSDHNPECTLDQQNIQYNVIMRKIDSSMDKLEAIIRNDPQIKPKQILQFFAKSIGEEDDNFLYQKLSTRNVRRSIKKYFDNAVAKVKGKLRHQ